jgi:alpha-1,2-mannosyltransferase
MPEASLLRRDRLALALLVFLAIGVGVVVELRSAYMQRRHTDLGVYLRASWAIREGIDHYTVTDDNCWHYTYPSLLAIALIPFADAPPGTPQPVWAVPYPVSVAFWYLLSVGLLAWSVHHLCRALEDTHPDGPRPAAISGRRFWWTRTWPLWVCLPAIGSTLFRGQVNLLTLALVSGCIAAAIRGRRASAGWWLAAATCVKVIPGLLVLYPLVRRDWKMLSHFVLGIIAGVVLIPAVVLGPERALTTTETFVNQTILPGLTTQPGKLSTELTDMNSTDNQSVQAIIHAAVNWNESPRPRAASAGTKLAHAATGLTLIILTFLAGRRIPDERYRTLFQLSGLLITAVAITPVNHTHYMALAVPAVLGLVYWELERRGKFVWGWALVTVAVLHVASGIWPRIPNLPGFQAARDLGVTMLGTLLVWFASLRLPTGSAARTPVTAPAPTGAVRLPGVGVFK